MKDREFIYIGKGKIIENERKVTFKLELENEVPPNIYTEFVEKV